MDDVALANFVAGAYFGNVEAGRVGRLCGQLLAIEPGTAIWFSEYTLMKLRERHGEINFLHYPRMKELLLEGFIAQGRGKHLVELWWIDANNRQGFSAVIKATKKREVFVATFHRTDIKESRRLYAKSMREGRLVRVQKGVDQFIQPQPQKAKKRK